MRSCSRLGRPCQNSYSSGCKVYPPQNGGRGTSLPSNFFSVSFKRFSSSSRLRSTSLCAEVQAPSWLSRGRDEKYSSDSLSLCFTNFPANLTCLCNSGQKKSKQAKGICSMSFPFL